jgi:hypothetical protein
METQTIDRDLFLDLETQLHRKEVRNSKEKLSALLADDFVEFGSSGFKYNKTSTIDSLGKESIDLEISVEDFESKYLSNDVVLVTYKTSKINPDSGIRFQSLRSSIWKNNSGRWEMVFHQGTKIPA